MSKTPRELLDEYQAAAEAMPWHLRWWYRRKAQKAQRDWDGRRDAALTRVIEAEQEHRNSGL